MDDVGMVGVNAHAMGPRVPAVGPREVWRMGTATTGFKTPSRIGMMGRSETTTACVDANLCQKPAGGSTSLIIGLGIA
jgi:hypothetical protein